jgi:hypothetical protein
MNNRSHRTRTPLTVGSTCWLLFHSLILSVHSQVSIYIRLLRTIRYWLLSHLETECSAWNQPWKLSISCLSCPIRALVLQLASSGITAEVIKCAMTVLFLFIKHRCSYIICISSLWILLLRYHYGSRGEEAHVYTVCAQNVYRKSCPFICFRTHFRSLW